MGKSTKQTNGKAAKVAKVADPLTSVKSAGVSKSKKAAKEVAPKVSAKDLKKKKKVESESESSESEEEEDSEDSEEDSDESPDSDSDSESEKEKKPAAKAKAAVAAPAAKNNGKAKKAVKSDSSDSSDSSDDDEEDSDDDEGGAETAAASKAKKDESSDDSEDDDEDSDGSDDSEESDSEETEEKAAEPASKKRKADEETAAPVKKAKSENTGEEEVTTLFVGNLGWGIDDDLLYKAFEECDGLSSARVVTDKHMQRSRGFGYVDFKTADACKAAHEKMQGFELEGRPMNLDFSKPKSEDATPNARANDRAQKHGDTVSPESDTLFVGNLPFEADEDMVTAFFSDAAEVKSLRLPTDPESGNRKGFGYVTFNSIDDAKSAFNSKNGGYIGEGRGARAVRLDYASQRPPREGGGGFGGRGGGRGGGGFGGGRGGGGRGGGGFGGRGGGGRGGFGGRGGGRGGGGGFGGGRGGGGFQGKKITF